MSALKPAGRGVRRVDPGLAYLTLGSLIGASALVLAFALLGGPLGPASSGPVLGSIWDFLVLWGALQTVISVIFIEKGLPLRWGSAAKRKLGTLGVPRRRR